jgi:hypothetical protein
MTRGNRYEWRSGKGMAYSELSSQQLKMSPWLPAHKYCTSQSPADVTTDVRYKNLSNTASELLAMNKLRLRTAVGLLTGHTSLRAHLHKLGHTERQECRLCGYDKEDSVHFVCECPVLACKRYRIWGCMFLKPEDLKKVRVSSPLSLVANTGLGLVS